jgi:hypothetical protein
VQRISGDHRAGQVQVGQQRLEGGDLGRVAQGFVESDAHPTTEQKTLKPPYRQLTVHHPV